MFTVHWKILKDGEWERYSAKVDRKTPAEAATYIAKKYVGAIVTKVKKG
jgi:hypothetical protein